jgi:hypothetical protein
MLTLFNESDLPIRKKQFLFTGRHAEIIPFDYRASDGPSLFYKNSDGPFPR